MFGWIFAPAVSKSKGLPKRVRENCASSSPKSGKNNLMVCICFKHGVFLIVQRGGKYAGPKVVNCSYFAWTAWKSYSTCFWDWAKQVIRN